VKAFRAIFATALFYLAFGQVARAAEEFRGSWTLAPSAAAGKVQFGLIRRHGGGQSMSQSDWPVAAFAGLDLRTAGRRDTQFAITREAGRIDCEGYLANGTGAGTFRFTPDPKYVQAMRALGFTGIDENEQFAMMLHDVTSGFAREMKAENLSGLDTQELIALAIFDVTSTFIRELRAEGMPAQRADALVAFRVHGVTPAFVREVKKAGLNPTEDQLIAFRVHEVTPEFIEKIGDLGFGQPEPDMLVALRVHDVTPEYIANMRARGLENLTLDKLVSLKIHEID
jgi:hypothetical protein